MTAGVRKKIYQWNKKEMEYQCNPGVKALRRRTRWRRWRSYFLSAPSVLRACGQMSCRRTHWQEEHQDRSACSGGGDHQQQHRQEREEGWGEEGLQQERCCVNEDHRRIWSQFQFGDVPQVEWWLYEGEKGHKLKWSDDSINIIIKSITALCYQFILMVSIDY